MRRAPWRPGPALAVLSLAAGAAGLLTSCGAGDNGGTVPVPASTSSTAPGAPATGSTLPGGG